MAGSTKQPLEIENNLMLTASNKALASSYNHKELNSVNDHMNVEETLVRGHSSGQYFEFSLVAPEGKTSYPCPDI